MKTSKELSPAKIVLWSASMLFVIWIVFHFGDLTSTQNGFIRFSLGLFFFLMILFRKKPASAPLPKNRKTAPLHSNVAVLASAITGALLTICSIIFTINQLEWLGTLLLMYACLRWALPERYSKDIPPSLMLLYFAHPLPGQIFGPLQLFMQQLSVNGSERFLHFFNIRAWADGMVLLTGRNIFEIPGWCSGMRTATTVFLLALGLGILRRMKWYECAVLTFAALLQALLLNILRISLMVILTPVGGGRASADFLHSSLWVVLFAGIFLVYVEINVYQNRKRMKEKQGNQPSPHTTKMFSDHPPFWQLAIAHKQFIFPLIVIIFTGFFAIKRSTPTHRAGMIMDVVAELRDTGKLDEAFRAAKKVESLIPEDEEWKLTIMRLLVLRGKYDELLLWADTITFKKTDRIEIDVLRAYSMMGKGDMDAAAHVVDRMADNVPETDPRAAMVIAELARRSNDPDRVAKNVVTASIWQPNIVRIRHLYPFLNMHKKWEAIVTSDIKTQPYTDAAEIFSAIEAYMNLDKTADVSNLALQAGIRWPNDPRVLIPLYYMTTRRSEPQWEKLFAEQLEQRVSETSRIGLLYNIINKCFSLARPDLAWKVIERISEIDSSHPALFLATARYGDAWFIFRSHYLGLPSSSRTDKINLKPFYLMIKPYLGRLNIESATDAKKDYLAKTLSALALDDKQLNALAESASVNEARSLLEQMSAKQSRGDLFAKDLVDRIASFVDLKTFYSAANSTKAWQFLNINIPFGEELSLEVTSTLKRKLLKKAISEFAKREKEGSLSTAMQHEYVRALESRDDIASARKQLNKMLLSSGISEKKRQDVLSKIYENRGQWQEVYETLYSYTDSPGPDQVMELQAMVRLCRAQMNLRMGLGALDTAKKALALFPYSGEAVNALVTALMMYDSSEEALHILSLPRDRHKKNLAKFEALCLYNTQRYTEMQALCRNHLITPIPVPLDSPQVLELPQAERASQWHLDYSPSNEATEKSYEIIRKNLKDTTSPFLKDMMNLWVDFYKAAIKNKDLAKVSNIDKWKKAGRNKTEQATALNNLTLLQCWRKEYDKARETAQAATELMPHSPMLWRINISLSGARPDVIQQARKNCADDSEIWLAEVVSNLTRNNPFKMRDSLPYTVVALTRAADYLLRTNHADDASKLSKYAINKARGLLPAYIVDLKCAIDQEDRDRAHDSITKAIEVSIRPRSFLYQKLVAIKIEEGSLATDKELIDALNNLREKDPLNPAWAQMLGYIRFQRGGSDIIDAKHQMTSAIEGGASNKAPFIIAASSARQLGNINEAISILRRGVELHPDNLEMLNNLGFVLSLDPDASEEAIALVPRLLEKGSDKTEVLDTISSIYISAGHLDKASELIKRILTTAEHGETPWFRARMMKANIILLSAENSPMPLAKEEAASKAEAILKEILKKSHGISSDDIIEANALLRKCNK